MCANDLLHGDDVDVDRFAESLRAIADGLEEGAVHTKELASTKCATAGDIADFELTIRYVAERGDERVTEPLRYIGEDGGDG